MELERRPQPLYIQVKELISDRIHSGEWPPDTQVPSENQLVSTLGLSRMTINRALRELTSEGHLVRVQGVGTFVARRKPQASLLEIKSIADEIKSWGGAYSNEVILLQEEAVSKDLAEETGLAAGSPIYHSVLVHKHDGTPIQLADRYVNPAVAPDYLKQNFRQITPSEYLTRVAPATEAEHVVEAVMPDKAAQKLLEIRPDEPCLVLYRKTWVGAQAATKNKFIYPGSRYRLGGRFKP